MAYIINMAALASNYSPIFYKNKTNDRENKTVTFFAIVSLAKYNTYNVYYDFRATESIF